MSLATPLPATAKRVSREDRWERRPRLAMLVRAVIFLGPVAIATDVSLVVTWFLPEPHDLGQSIGWWVAVIATSSIALFVSNHLFRRLLPLTVLLDLALVFPGVAPSRFSTAFRAGGIRNLQRRIEQAKEDAPDAETADAAATVVELVAALAVHDPKTRGHSERTRAYADLIAEELGLPAEDRDRLRWSALLHDIGKLHVTPKVLNKPDPPEAEEWEALLRHPMEGARIIGGLRTWLGPWGLAIEQHHEHFDGTGYPLGLKGEEISLAGRIVAVADAYEVMTSARSYTPPVAPRAAREELVRCAGQHFDPDIVKAFLRVAIGRFPKPAGLLVVLAQIPGFVGRTQVFQSAGSAAVAGASVAALAAGGVVAPGASPPGIIQSAPPPAVTENPGSSGASSDLPGPGSADAPEEAASAIGGSAWAPSPDSPATGGSPATGESPTVGASPKTPGSPSTSQSPTTAAPTTASTTPTTTASTATSTTAPANSGTMAGTAPVAGRSYLGGTNGGSPTPADLRSTPPDGRGTPDYDSDGLPGRTLAPSSRPETTVAAEEHQLWVGRFTGGVRISGIPKLTIWSSVAGFESGRGHLRAYLFDCDGSGGACLRQPIATASLNDPKWSDGSGGFTTKTLTFTSVDHVLASGRTLVLRLGVQKGSNPLVVAYGTEDHAAFLAIDVSSSE